MEIGSNIPTNCWDVSVVISCQPKIAAKQTCKFIFYKNQFINGVFLRGLIPEPTQGHKATYSPQMPPEFRWVMAHQNRQAR